MPAPPGRCDLTGATRYRTNWMGSLVLQVEVREIAYWEGQLLPGVQRTPVYAVKWRDAAMTDMRMLDHLASKRAT